MDPLPRIKKCLLLAVAVACLQTAGAQQTRIVHKEIHVSPKGDNENDGSEGKPLRTISAAAQVAMPGNVVIVHAGVYRERIDPPRGGKSPSEGIWYQAAPGEVVEIKGSEVVKGWERTDSSIWVVRIPNQYFGSFNPYKDTMYGDWLTKGNWSHTGEVYLNGKPLTEVREQGLLHNAGTDSAFWYCKVDEHQTTIYANFNDANPNEQLVEINVRRAVFYPSKPGIDFIGVKGFTMSHAATPWAPPTAEQIGLIGTHWSKGWVIENNEISYSKCVGITLGKYGDEWDNRSESVEGYIKTIERAASANWNKEHIGGHLVRNNRISYCGQAGIAGSLGAVFSTISGNTIHDIAGQQLFWGYEMAGIKLHAAVDVEISHNHIYRTEGGIWLDWMAQGTHVTRNFLHDNRVQDFSLEVNHGPILVDNNLFLSPQLAQVRLSQGVAFVHNLIAWDLWPTDSVDPRKTPYLQPHSTAIAGFHPNPCGDTRYFNNVLLGRTNLTPYDHASMPVKMEGNVFLLDAKPSMQEKQPLVFPAYEPRLAVKEKSDGWYLVVNLKKDWDKKHTQRLVTGAMLGTAMVPSQSFTHENGQLLLLNTDYTGKKRDTAHPSAGPFEISKSGLQEIKVW